MGHQATISTQGLTAVDIAAVLAKVGLNVSDPETSATELTLDKAGGEAFERLAKGLRGLGASLIDTGVELENLGMDLVVAPVTEAEDSLDVEQALQDLAMVIKQASDPEIVARMESVALLLKRKHERKKGGEDGNTLILQIKGEMDGLAAMLQHIAETASIGHSFPVVVDPDDSEHRRKFEFDGDGAFRLSIQTSKADLTTGDLAAGGGLRLPAQDTLAPRFQVRPAGDVYEVVDTETGRALARGLSEEAARADANRRNAAIRKALGERVGIFLRVPKILADQLPSLGEHDESPRHATLLQVGELDEQNFDAVIKAVQEVAKAVEPFDVDLEDFGEFKNAKDQTIVHLVPRAHGDVGLEELHKRLKDEVTKTGIEPTHHPGPFKPHVTLAYVDPDQEFAGERTGGSFHATTLEVWGEHGGEFGRVVVALGSGEVVEIKDSTKRGADEDTTELTFKVCKRDDEDDFDDDERIVFGVVLEPEVEDSQGDIYSAEEIEKTAFKFMERYQQFGLMHKQIVQSILPLQSYLAPVDFELNGQKIKKGTWLLGVRVLDAGIWSDVKSGRLTGFSIGGSAIRRDETISVAA